MTQFTQATRKSRWRLGKGALPLALLVLALLAISVTGCRPGGPGPGPGGQDPLAYATFTGGSGVQVRILESRLTHRDGVIEITVSVEVKNQTDEPINADSTLKLVDAAGAVLPEYFLALREGTIIAPQSTGLAKIRCRPKIESFASSIYVAIGDAKKVVKDAHPFTEADLSDPAGGQVSFIAPNWQDPKSQQPIPRDESAAPQHQ